MKKLLILFSCCAINFNCSSQPIAPDVIPAPSIPDPSPIVNFKAWENYIGHTGFNKSNTNYQWRRIVRQGRFDPTTTSGFNTAVTILSANHLMFGSNTGYPGANDIGNANADKPDNALAQYLNKQLETSCQDVKNLVEKQARKLLEARKRIGTKHSIYWQLGNEINNSIYPRAFKAWCTDAGMPYPHPQSPAGSGSSDSNDDGTDVDDITTSVDTGYIGYMMEYYVAPALEALLKVNAELPEEEQILLLAGSLANSRNPDNRNWYQLLLNYEFVGTFAPTLTGKHYYELLDGITHHYLFAEYRQSATDPMNPGKNRHDVLTEMWKTFVDNGKTGNRIRMIYTTEEIGNKASVSGRGAYLSIIIALSYIDYWLENGIAPEFGRVIFYGPEQTTTGDNKSFVPASFSMNVLAELIPGRELERAPEVFAEGNNATLEKYAFRTNRGELLLAIHTPSPASVTKPSLQDFEPIRLRLPDDGTTYSVISGGSHLFTIDEYLCPKAVLFASDGFVEISLQDTANRTNGSVKVESGKLTKFNGTYILVLKEQKS